MIFPVGIIKISSKLLKMHLATWYSNNGVHSPVFQTNGQILCLSKNFFRLISVLILQIKWCHRTICFDISISMKTVSLTLLSFNMNSFYIMVLMLRRRWRWENRWKRWNAFSKELIGIRRAENYNIARMS